MEKITAGHVILIEEDERFSQQIINYLEDNDFQAASVTPDVALEHLSLHKTDIILTESVFSDIEGQTLITQLLRSYPDIPLIVISKSHDVKDVIHALRLGACNFFQKPMKDFAPLEHAICRALEKNRLVLENENYRAALETLNQQLETSLSSLKEDQIAGRNVQKQLLPATHYSDQGITIDYKIIPSLYLSGDFVDYFKINEHKIAFYIADVSGHGASSAFVTVLLKSYIDKIIESYHQEQDDLILHPDQFLKKLSDYFFEIDLGKYLTMDYFILDTQTHALEYSIGGHYPNPILYDGEQAHYLKGSGFAVGIFDKARFQTETIQLPSSYQLSLFSDGIMEILPGENLRDNEAHLLTALSEGIQSLSDLHMRFEIDDNEPRPDDIAIFTLTRAGNT